MTTIDGSSTESPSVSIEFFSTLFSVFFLKTVGTSVFPVRQLIDSFFLFLDNAVLEVLNIALPNENRYLYSVWLRNQCMFFHVL